MPKEREKDGDMLIADIEKSEEEMTAETEVGTTAFPSVPIEGLTNVDEVEMRERRALTGREAVTDTRGGVRETIGVIGEIEKKTKTGTENAHRPKTETRNRSSLPAKR